MLDFIYYPVSAILWLWHEVFGRVPGLGMDSGIAWAFSVVFLVFTLRTLLLKPFITQVRSMRKMQEFAPEMQKIKKKYGDDRQKMAAEMQKLQQQQGFNPMGGCLPMVVQIPVFIGIFHVLRSFDRTDTFGLTVEQNRQIANYVFSPQEVTEFLDATFFGVPLSGQIVDPRELLAGELGTIPWEFGLVTVPLTILAGILTHITARHSVSRQSEAQSGNAQAQIMNKLMLYMFPLGIVIAGPFFPLGIVFYWLSNNLWTLGQQRVIYKKIDAEEAEQKEAAAAQRQNLGPRPGQKPERTKKGGAGTPGAVPAGGNVSGGNGTGGVSGGNGTGGVSGGNGTGGGDGERAISGSGAGTGDDGGRALAGSAERNGGRNGAAGSGGRKRKPWESTAPPRNRNTKKSGRKSR